MKKIKFIVFTCVLFTTLSAGAKSLELTRNTGSIFIQEKTNWKMGKDLFGMPFIYFSPQVNGQRSNISFTDTGANLELDMKALDKNQSDFKKSKEAWAKT